MLDLTESEKMNEFILRDISKNSLLTLPVMTISGQAVVRRGGRAHYL